MQIGQILPLYVQSGTYNAGKFVHAILRDDDNALIGIPIVLQAVSTEGLYGNNTVPFPTGTQYVTVQYVFYDDSGYTVLSTSEGGSSDTFTLGLLPGQPLPIYVQTFDYNPSVYVQAVLRNASSTVVGTVNLLPVGALGLYGNNLTTFPGGTQFVTAEYIFYSDSGYTQISATEGGTNDIFSVASLAGQAIPLFVQSFDYDDTKWVQAFLRDDQNNLIGSPIVLLPIGTTGLYGNNLTLFPGNTTFITAEYVFYDDSGYTEISLTQGGDFETFYPFVYSTAPIASYITGFLDGSNVCPDNALGIEDVIVQGTARTLNLRLVSQPNELPFDITNATNISCRFLNAAGSVLVLNSTDAGAPVGFRSAAAGLFYCILTAAQTALLQTGDPQPFTVIVTMPGGNVIVNFPYQLGVEAQLV